MPRIVLTAVILAFGAGLGAAPPIETARQHAARVQPLVTAALSAQATPGGKLAAYAALPAGDTARWENLTDAARRILAGGASTKHPPDETIALLNAYADAIFAAVDATELSLKAAPDVAVQGELATLRAQAHLARFHARRIVAAMHYNLFLRGLRLAELVAATYAEKDAVEAWRQLTTLPAAPELTATRRAELKKLEASLKDLEDQCCPPDENILREKVWQPARPGDATNAKP